MSCHIPEARLKHTWNERMIAELKKTPLFGYHKSLNARMAPFAGWSMPLSYQSVLKEHEKVRTKSGLFDVSHMGELTVSGEDALNFLQYLTINDVAKLRPGLGQYTAMCYESGGIVDDLLLYCLSRERYLLCVNAANREKDLQWIRGQSGRFSRLNICDASEKWAQLAIQGPTSFAAFAKTLSPTNAQRLSSIPYGGILELNHHGQSSLIARTGYTGEKGFEWYLNPDQAGAVWKELLKTSPLTGLVPCGLGARDTLRLEACYLLYGQDMDETVTPLQAGIGWVTRLDCGDFIGRKAISAQNVAGVSERIVAFKMTEQGIPRNGMGLSRKGQLLGRVTSGSVLPSLGGAGGLAMVKSGAVKTGDLVGIHIRGRIKTAVIEKKPMYKAKVH